MTPSSVVDADEKKAKGLLTALKEQHAAEAAAPASTVTDIKPTLSAATSGSIKVSLK
jgi:hypothetical protein